MPRRSLGALGDLTARTSAFWVFLARRAVATLVWQGLKISIYVMQKTKTLSKRDILSKMLNISKNKFRIEKRHDLFGEKWYMYRCRKEKMK